MVGIYKITNRITKDFYIGQSTNIKHRMYNHRQKGIHSPKFEDHISRYGWKAFDFEVIEECSKAELLEKEAEYIAKLRPTYNTIVRGAKRDRETIEKIRAKASGVVQSQETIKKRRTSILKRHETIPQTNEKHKKRVLVDGIEFESVKSAASFLGCDASSITRVKRQGNYKGHSVRYVV